jgi:hypothetical protein
VKRNLTFVFVLLLSVSVFAQGKVFSATDADNTFGKVTSEIKISVTDFKTHLSKTEKSFLVNIINNDLYVLGDGRKALTSNASTLDAKVVVHKFGKTVVEAFLEKVKEAGNSVIYIQLRGETLTITDGVTMLEYSQLCPPICG